MFRSTNTRRKPNQIGLDEDEIEILNINYDELLNTCNFNNLQKNFLEENVEMSLELQITNSLKNIVASSRNENLSLLDVTIVQPLNQVNYNNGCVENTVALTSSKVRKLLEVIDSNENRTHTILESHKESQFGQCKPVKGLNNISVTKSKSFLDKQMKRKLETHRQKLKRKVSSKHGQISVSSDLTKKVQCTNLEQTFGKTNMDLELKNSSSVTVLKPLQRRTHRSFKYLENHLQVGDNLDKYTGKTRKKSYPLLIPTKDSYTSTDYNKKLSEHEILFSNAPKIYATPKTFDRLKHIFECQNQENRSNNPHNKDIPCTCQHCELIGVLMDSQKKPFLSTSPTAKSSCKSKNQSYSGKGNAIYRRELQPNGNIRSKHKNHEYDSAFIIQELSNRLEALEKRVANQEQLTVPKDYFKRVINKLINKQLKTSSRNSSGLFKSIGTQYYPIEKLEKELKIKKAHKSTKYRNVQIQQNERTNFVANPVLLQSTFKSSCHEVHDKNSKSFGINPITAISDYFLKKGENDKKDVNFNSSKTKSPFENFYRWGEEIIKPGFDLKTKILSLLAEQIENFKNPKSTSCKNKNSKQCNSSSVKVKAKSSSSSNCKEFSTNSISKINMSQEHSINEDKQSIPISSNKTLKKMLNLMSEKIYNDHVKPTVNSIKHEQQSINNNNSLQVFNIKKVRNDALEKIKLKENNIKISNTSNKIQSKSICNRTEWKAGFLEPLEIPSSIKSNACNSKRYAKTAKPIRKSGIPVRVANPVPTESISSSNVKFKDNAQLLIPQLQSTINKNDFECVHSTDQFKDKIKYLKRLDKAQNSGNIKSYKQVSTNEIDNQQNGLVTNPNEEKCVQIKYMNPKALLWTDESSVSIKVKSSRYN